MPCGLNFWRYNSQLLLHQGIEEGAFAGIGLSKNVYKTYMHIKKYKLKIRQAADFAVAKGRIELPTFGLWAQRATAALLRDMKQSYDFFLFLPNFATANQSNCLIATSFPGCFRLWSVTEIKPVEPDWVRTCEGMSYFAYSTNQSTPTCFGFAWGPENRATANSVHHEFGGD